MTDATAPLVWMDLEMSGLNAAEDTILEVATVVTDGELDVLAEGPALAIHQPEAVLAGMDDWNREHHAASGLTERVRASPVSLAEAEAVTLAFVRRHCEPQMAPLAGNSVWQDRRFLARLMPTLEAYLHYRLVDVSTIKELARRWRPALVDGFKKRNTHRALDDIHESIAELRHYRQFFFSVEQTDRTAQKAIRQRTDELPAPPERPGGTLDAGSRHACRRVPGKCDASR